MALTVYIAELGVNPAGITSAEMVGRPSVAGGRKPNAAYRQREHLTEAEVYRLMAAARDNRYGARDAALIFVMFRHGFCGSRRLEAAEAERQTAAKPEFSKVRLGAALGLLGFGLFMWATHAKQQA